MIENKSNNFEDMRNKQNIKTTDWLIRGMTKEEIAKEKEEAIKEAEVELRDKQIEEIVTDFCPLYQEFGSCKRCNQDLNIDKEPCYYGCVANLIIDYDYRKASEVAEEIIAIIEVRLANNTESRKGVTSLHGKGFYEGRAYAYRDIKEIVEQKYLAELKKKYTEGGE